jgi:predicted permease
MLRVIESITKDLRFALRQLIRSPGFTAVSVLSLALGIGSATAIFSLVNAILLRSLPVPNPHELRELRWAGTEARIPSWDGAASVSPPVFFSLREQGAKQAEIFGFSPLEDVIVRTQREAFTAKGMMVSENFFSGLGVWPLIGRPLAAGEDYAGASMNIVISHDCWERHFAIDPSVVGQTIALNGTSFTIIGVLPRGFSGVQLGNPSEFYVPLSAHSPFLYRPITETFHWFVRLMARLRPGASDAQLGAALDVVFAREVGALMKEPRMLVEPGHGGTTYDRISYRRPLLLMLGVVGLVMLVSCANLAGLSLARGAARQHELAVCAALGAGRWRLIRQSLTESLVLALFGGGLGVLLANWGRTAIARLLAGSAGELRYDFSLDRTVLGFTLVVALITALLSGLLPALRAGRVDPLSGFKTRGALGARRLRTGRVLVAAQICLSLVLLAGAGLYLRTLVNLTRIDAGFSTEKLLLFQLNLRGSNYATAQPAQFYGRVQASLAAIPGVKGATLLEFPLLNNSNSSGGFTFFGRPADPSVNLQTRRLTVGETFFATMGIPVLQGRGLSEGDSEGTPKVIVVNETFVRKYLPDKNPLGQTVKMWDAGWQIVGVCRDAKYTNLKEAVPPTTYFPFRQRFYSRFRQTHLRGAYFAVRATLPPLTLTTAVRKAVAEIDAGVPIVRITTQEEVRDQGISQERLFATLCGALGGLAVLLSCIGLYGLMAYHVARRTSEIAIRKALGATRCQISGPILREALWLACIGVAAGLPASIAVTRLIKSQLFGVQPNDPLTLLLVIITLVAIALFSAWLPARQAAKVDPMAALRVE